MSFRTQDAFESKQAALEELRTADRMLAGVGSGGVPPSSLIGRWSLFDWLTGTTVENEMMAAKTQADGEVLHAQAHIRRAIALVNGDGWTKGVANDGSQLVLHTAVGLRRATREFFDRILASDPRLPDRVAPLGEW